MRKTRTSWRGIIASSFTPLSHSRACISHLGQVHDGVINTPLRQHGLQLVLGAVAQQRTRGPACCHMGEGEVEAWGPAKSPQHEPGLEVGEEGG